MSSSIVILVLAATTQRPLPTPPPKDLVLGLPLVQKVLTTVSEPHLPATEQAEKAVRIVMIPAFPGMRAVVSRFTLRADGLEVVTKTLVDWLPGPGKVVVLPTTQRPTSRWSEIDGALVPGLWLFQPGPFPDPRVMDGAIWFVEASGPRGHVAVIQHSPGDGPFRNLCRKLMWESGVDFTEWEFVSWFAAR